MVTKLQKHGEQWALMLDQATVDQLHITTDSPLQVAATPGQLAIASAVDPEFERIVQEINVQYADVFRRLAE